MKQTKESYKSGEKALTQKQVEKLFEHVTDLQDLALIKLAIDVGLRRSDIVGVKRRDVDLENNKITFNEKKKKRTKTVYISDDTKLTLQRWLNINKSDWLFPSRFKKKKDHLSSRSAYNILRKYTKSANIPDIPFHALRATCVKLHQIAGWTPEQTAKLIGDKVSTVQQHYSVPSEQEMAEITKEKPIF